MVTDEVLHSGILQLAGHVELPLQLFISRENVMGV
jgi:hypothetical protein